MRLNRMSVDGCSLPDAGRVCNLHRNQRSLDREENLRLYDLLECRKRQLVPIVDCIELTE